MKQKTRLLSGLILVAIMACTCLFACNPDNTPAKNPSVLVVGTTMSVDTLNRLDAAGGAPGYNFDKIASTVSQLTAIAKIDGKFEGVACDYKVSDGGAIVSFTLKDGFSWHDGTALSIDDVKYTLDGALTQDTDYTDVLVTGSELVYTINTLDSVFLTKVASANLFPKHLFEGKTKDTLTDEESVVGAGPFKYVGRDTAAGTITFEKYDEYPYAENVKIDKVIFKTYGNFDVLAQALKSGEVDMIYNYGGSIDATTADAFSQESNISLLSFATKQITKAMFFNNAKMTNANVKRAIAKSIDFDKIRETFGDATATAAREGLVAPGIDGYKETAEWTRDLEGAKALLKQEGYTESNKFRFELLVHSGTDDTQYASLLKTQIEESGLVEVVLVEKGSDWQTYYQEGNHMASLVKITAKGYDFEAGYASRYTLTTDTDLVDMEKNPVAHGQVADKDVYGNLTQFGTILNAIATAKTTAQRDNAVGEYQDYIVENVICVPFFYGSTVQAVSAKLDGFKFDSNCGILNVKTFETLTKS
ncbi:MAG: ABC transporter substrate-binding protein [Christensenellales bacterium]